LPIKTVTANSFDKFDYVNGGVRSEQVEYWEMADTPGSGTWYYAVTSVEWCGLESRALSNVYSNTGNQTTPYPSAPKGKSGFITTYNDNIIRYYNIYAENGNIPSPIQQNRIASIPNDANTVYIDWLGNPDGSTQYVITGVDSQGNESAILKTISGTHQQAPSSSAGQYLVTWSTDNKDYTPIINSTTVE
jgi:hypothetical protein